MLIHFTVKRDFVQYEGEIFLLYVYKTCIFTCCIYLCKFCIILVLDEFLKLINAKSFHYICIPLSFVLFWNLMKKINNM